MLTPTFTDRFTDECRNPWRLRNPPVSPQFIRLLLMLCPSCINVVSTRCSSCVAHNSLDDFCRCFTSSVQNSSGNPWTEKHYSSRPSTLLLHFLACQIMDVPDGHHLPPHINPPNDANPRRLQQLSTLADRKNIINWMVEDEVIHGFNRLYRRAIIAFLANFWG